MRLIKETFGATFIAMDMMASASYDKTRALAASAPSRTHTASKKRNATNGFAIHGDVFNHPKGKRAKRRAKHKRNK